MKITKQPPQLLFLLPLPHQLGVVKPQHGHFWETELTHLPRVRVLHRPHQPKGLCGCDLVDQGSDYWPESLYSFGCSKRQVNFRRYLDQPQVFRTKFLV